jgi:hypothetical protein
VNVFCEVIETDLKKKETLFSKENYETQKKIWKTTSFQNEQANLMDINGDGEIDVDEFKIWFREFFNLNLSYLFVKRATIEILFEKLDGVNGNEKSKVNLQIFGEAGESKSNQLAQRKIH